MVSGIRASRWRITVVALVAITIATLLVFGVRGWRKAQQVGPARLVIVTTGTIDAAVAPRARGCGAAHASPQGEAMTTKSGPGGPARPARKDRTFHVWGPSTYDAAVPYPVVLAFHGWGSNGLAFEKWFKMEDHVRGAAFVIYPDASGANWDFGGNLDLDFTADILDAVAESWCIDRARVLAFGFSYGARFVHHLGCKRPNLVRAIAAGGGSWDPESECSALPVLVTHRTRDATMRIAGGKDAAARWAKINGCIDATEELDSAHGCVGYRGCTSGAVTFCEDVHHDASWPSTWNHTVREEYRALTWAWFEALR